MPTVVAQHIEESSHLRRVRRTLVRSPHVQLHHLQRCDDRLLANIDGLFIAGRRGVDIVNESLEDPGAEVIFLSTTMALEFHDAALLGNLFTIAAVEPQANIGIRSAFGWVSAPVLQGVIQDLLCAAHVHQRAIGLAACVMHRVDPGSALVEALAAIDETLLPQALRVVGEAGRIDLLPHVLSGCLSKNGVLRFWAARSVLLLGSQSPVALTVLRGLAEGTGPSSDAAAELVLKALDLPTAHQHLRHWVTLTKADTPAAAQARRRLLRRCGITGDPHLIPWLIAQMTDLRLTRLAGEAFSMITGADLAWLDLDRKPPAGVDFGPNDDPEDDNVAMDEDDGLPWPDPDKVQAWWQAQQHRFPAGQRFFIGEPPSPAHALKVLRDGYQRQRIAAAQWACMLAPGTPLFPTAAPAWRQQRWLKAMG
ncbi:TIGR02270 family protein [uncultured Sphaerotilus sp.]|uniref:TIGR02270 family protein n=1 Tax=uncultured Sphaerotilus sp. TaxID=474984 RepID=UPI0030CA231B